MSMTTDLITAALEAYSCLITSEPSIDPVRLSGHPNDIQRLQIYDRKSIADWLTTRGKCVETRVPLTVATAKMESARLEFLIFLLAAQKQSDNILGEHKATIVNCVKEITAAPGGKELVIEANRILGKLSSDDNIAINGQNPFTFDTLTTLMGFGVPVKNIRKQGIYFKQTEADAAKKASQAPAKVAQAPARGDDKKLSEERKIVQENRQQPNVQPNAAGGFSYLPQSLNDRLFALNFDMEVPRSQNAGAAPVRNAGNSVAPSQFDLKNVREVEFTHSDRNVQRRLIDLHAEAKQASEEIHRIAQRCDQLATRNDIERLRDANYNAQFTVINPFEHSNKVVELDGELEHLLQHHKDFGDECEAILRNIIRRSTPLRSAANTSYQQNLAKCDQSVQKAMEQGLKDIQDNIATIQGKINKLGQFVIMSKQYVDQLNGKKVAARPAGETGLRYNAILNAQTKAKLELKKAEDALKSAENAIAAHKKLVASDPTANNIDARTQEVRTLTRAVFSAEPCVNTVNDLFTSADEDHFYAKQASIAGKAIETAYNDALPKGIPAAFDAAKVQDAREIQNLAEITAIRNQVKAGGVVYRIKPGMDAVVATEIKRISDILTQAKGTQSTISQWATMAQGYVAHLNGKSVVAERAKDAVEFQNKVVNYKTQIGTIVEAVTKLLARAADAKAAIAKTAKTETLTILTYVNTIQECTTELANLTSISSLNSIYDAAKREHDRAKANCDEANVGLKAYDAAIASGANHMDAKLKSIQAANTYYNSVVQPNLYGYSSAANAGSGYGFGGGIISTFSGLNFNY